MPSKNGIDATYQKNGRTYRVKVARPRDAMTDAELDARVLAALPTPLTASAYETDRVYWVRIGASTVAK